MSFAGSIEDRGPEEGGVPLPPDYSPNPFAPDPSIWPDAPDWLFPAVVVLVIAMAITIIVLLYMWWKAAQYAKAERAKLPTKEWIDLDSISKRRYSEESDRPRKPEPKDPDDD